MARYFEWNTLSAKVAAAYADDVVALFSELFALSVYVLHTVWGLGAHQMVESDEQKEHAHRSRYMYTYIYI